MNKRIRENRWMQRILVSTRYREIEGETFTFGWNFRVRSWIERMEWRESNKGLLFRSTAAFNFSNSPHSRGHVPMNHSDTFLRHGLRSPVRPPDAIIARRFVRDLVRYHFTGLVAPIYYVSQIGRNNFSPPVQLFSFAPSHPSSSSTRLFIRI